MANDPATDFLIISKARMMHHYLPKLRACLDVLDEERLWFEESERSNSIGGIVRHLMEHARRNAVRLLNPDVRFEKGIENEFPNRPVAKERLLAELEQAFEQLAAAIDDRLRDTDGYDMYDLYHLVEHTGYHLGQIVDRTQRDAGVSFQFVQNGINEQALREQVRQEWTEHRREERTADAFTDRLKLRKAGPSDLTLLAEMNSRLIADEGSANPMGPEALRERMEGWLSADWQADLLCTGEQVVGYALYQFREAPYRQGELEVYLRQYYIEREYRRSGYGLHGLQLLLDERFREAGAVVVDVLETNERGRRFWSKAGFRGYARNLRLELKR